MKIPACGACHAELNMEDRSASRKWAAHKFAKDSLAVYCDSCVNVTVFRVKSSFFSGKDYEALQTLSEQDFKREFGHGPGLVRDQPGERLFAEIVALYGGRAKGTSWKESRDEAFAAVLSKLATSRAFEFLDDELIRMYESDQEKDTDKLRWLAAKLKFVSESESIDASTQARAKILLTEVKESLLGSLG
ncbi:MAG: hypothetical protein ABI972_31450 [Acidobacteriota bacterium]